MLLFLILLIISTIAGFPAYFFCKWLYSKMRAVKSNVAVLLSVLCGLISFAAIFLGEVCLFFWIFPLQR